MSSHFNEDEDLRLMKSTISSEFIKAFNASFKEYIKGNWKKAKEGLLHADIIIVCMAGPS